MADLSWNVKVCGEGGTEVKGEEEVDGVLTLGRVIGKRGGANAPATLCDCSARVEGRVVTIDILSAQCD